MPGVWVELYMPAEREIEMERDGKGTRGKRHEESGEGGNREGKVMTGTRDGN